MRSTSARGRLTRTWAPLSVTSSHWAPALALTVRRLPTGAAWAEKASISSRAAGRRRNVRFIRCNRKKDGFGSVTLERKINGVNKRKKNALLLRYYLSFFVIVALQTFVIVAFRRHPDLALRLAGVFLICFIFRLSFVFDFPTFST
jgi:hypothetical protein